MSLLVQASRPVSSASLAVFRILWGLVLAFECLTYLANPRKMATLTWDRFHFPFYGFEWIPLFDTEGALPGNVDLTLVALSLLFYVLLASSLLFSAGSRSLVSLLTHTGFLHRVFSIVFATGFTYVWLIDLTDYLNHFYLISIFTTLCAFVPLNGTFALDNLVFPSSRKRAQRGHAICLTSIAVVPAWTYWLLRSEIAIVYFYAGFAKINVDWLRGEPLRHWLLGHSRTEISLLGALFKLEIACYIFSYGGLFFDLLVPFLLVYERTRLLGFVLSAAFHIMNKIVFNIGIFPAAMGALTTLFLPQSWPYMYILRFKHWFRSHSSIVYLLPLVEAEKKLSKPVPTVQTYTLVLIGLFLLFNILFPIRFFIYPGDVAWHEHGHRFSWRMKLRDKNCEGAFILQNPITNLTSRGSMAPLTPRQQSKMFARPEMIAYYAHYLADKAEDIGQPRPRVYASVNCSLNFRRSQTLLDGTADLAAHGVWDWPYPFVTPLTPLTPEQEEQFLWRRLWHSPWALLQPANKSRNWLFLSPYCNN